MPQKPSVEEYLTYTTEETEKLEVTTNDREAGRQYGYAGYPECWQVRRRKEKINT